MRLLNIVEKVISKLKNDSQYKFSSEYSVKELLYISFYRFCQLLRGIRFKLRFKELKGFIFCGRSIIIEHPYLISAGKNLIIDDNSYINALSENGIILGDNVTISRNCQIVCTGVIARKGVGISIGNYSAIGAMSFIGGQGGLKIGNNVIMGAGVKIFTENHKIEDLFKFIRDQGETRKGIIIEDNCWVGADAIILDGVKIGTGSVIAAGSVVSHDVDSYSIVAGVPAKVIRKRE